MKDKNGSDAKTTAKVGRKGAKAKAGGISKASEGDTKTKKELIEEEAEKIYSEMAKDIEAKNARDKRDVLLMLLPSALPPLFFPRR